MEGKREKGIGVGGCVACKSRIKQIRMEAMVHGVRLIEVYRVSRVSYSSLSICYCANLLETIRTYFRVLCGSLFGSGLIQYIYFASPISMYAPPLECFCRISIPIVTIDSRTDRDTLYFLSTNSNSAVVSGGRYRVSGKG